MTAKEWNEQYPLYQDIELTEDDGSITRTQTRSQAWNLGHGAPVILVNGKAGGYDLGRIKAK